VTEFLPAIDGSLGSTRKSKLRHKQSNQTTPYEVLMKVIVTGSLGNISKPLTKELVQKGHHVTVISSNKEKQPDIEALGATAAIGSLEDVDCLVSTFTGADAVYTMVPPNNYFDLNRLPAKVRL
jgi:D-arabinose 1-dehydrogenase-like Zn-dependent alcohol dehydrogenase